MAPQAEKAKKSITGKRKSEITVNVTINASQLGNSASSEPVVNKPKRIKTSESSGNASATTPSQSRVKQTARRGGGSQSSRRPALVTRSPTPPPPPARCFARRGSHSIQPGRSRPPRNEGNAYSDYRHTDSFDEPPPPYEDYREDDKDRHDETTRLAPLGLLNGRYHVDSDSVKSQWPQYASDLSLVLTISGSSLLGRFDLGVIEGIIRFEERPWISSYDRIPFHWRGREAEGPISFNDEQNRGWIKFLGDGRIEGWIDHQGIEFEGRRLQGQGTRSEISARTMQDEWDEYNEEEYDRLNETRWR